MPNRSEDCSEGTRRVLSSAYVLNGLGLLQAPCLSQSFLSDLLMIDFLLDLGLVQAIDDRIISGGNMYSLDLRDSVSTRSMGDVEAQCELAFSLLWKDT